MEYYYEAMSVLGTSTPPSKKDPDVGQVAEEIEQIYAMADRRFGRIVAGHTLDFNKVEADNNGAEVVHRFGCLFLVLELPGQPPGEE